MTENITLRTFTNRTLPDDVIHVIHETTTTITRINTDNVIQQTNIRHAISYIELLLDSEITTENQHSLSTCNTQMPALEQCGRSAIKHKVASASISGCREKLVDAFASTSI